MVHGCNLLGILDGVVMSWVNYYRAAGLQVFLPDSFAEPRDGEMCGNPGEHGIDRQTRILKPRIAQTRHTAPLQRPAELEDGFPVASAATSQPRQGTCGDFTSSGVMDSRGPGLEKR